MMQLSQVSKAVGGELLGADVSLKNVSINTRSDCEGRLFVALKGDNFDAHAFVQQAAEAGASALLVEQKVESNLPTVTVKDTHQALMSLAAWWRAQFSIPMIAITGSVGKTTVKEMLACIFAELGKGVVTEGNLNNEIGAPLTLMRLCEDDLYAIVEMGMNHAGEIERISKMTQPNIALVNNAAAAHLEGLGSIQAVAKAKGEIYQGLSNDGVAIINADDEFADTWQQLAESHQVLTFALNSKADVTASYKELNGRLEIEVKTSDEKFSLSVDSLGEHSVRNVLAAIAVSLAANVSSEIIIKGLQKFTPVSGRMNVETLAGVTVIDDTYNANPASMLAAIKVLAKYPDNTMIVGDMAELGASTQQEHERLGVVASEHGIKNMLACGQHAQTVANEFGLGAIAFETQSDLLAYLQKSPVSGTILVKGSRSAKMEQVVIALHEKLSKSDQGDSCITKGEL